MESTWQRRCADSRWSSHSTLFDGNGAISTVFRFLAVGVLAGAAVAVDLPPKIAEPATLNWYRVDPVTGALAPLEDVVSVQESTGYRKYTFYLPGPTSFAAFPYGQRQLFVKLLFGPDFDEMREKPPMVLEYLASQKERRYATKQFVPLDVTTYGAVRLGLHPAESDRPALAYLFSPRAPLPPGEYAFSSSGLLTAWAGFSASPTRAGAFRIVNEVAAAPPPSASKAPSPTQTAAITPPPAVDMQQVRKAAEQGDARAQLRTGSAYATGTGLLQDFVEAHKWLNLAAARLEGEDRTRAATLRDQLSSRMTPEQLAEAQKKARDWNEDYERKRQ